MCVVCALWNLKKITLAEARKGLSELVNTETINQDHIDEVNQLLDKEEQDQT